MASAPNLLQPYNSQARTPPQGGGRSSPNDPYDTRIGNQGLPRGIYGADNRAYVSDVRPQETTSYNLNTLLSQNSPYLQLARQTGREEAAGRGLMNSSIAAGNSQRAAIQAAAPIAQADAEAYQANVRQNVDVLNQRDLAEINMDAAMASSAGAQMAAHERAQMELLNAREQRAFGGEQNELARQQDAYMQQMGYGYGLGLQNNQYGNQFNNDMRLGAFNAAVNSNFSSQNYYQQASIAAMNNPAIISNPQNFQNYLSFSQGPYQNAINQYLQFAFQGF